MDNRLMTMMAIFVVLGIALLFVINLTPVLQKPITQTYLARDTVRGVEVVHKGKPYTLNFEQQNSMITLLNASLPIKAGVPTSSLDFEKVIIYVFDAPNIILTPISYVDENLVFSVPNWNKAGFLKDNSAGELKKLISQTYDP
jgi:hypothetical protein